MNIIIFTFIAITFGKVITECEVENSLALTFDDGPFVYTEELLDLLKKENVQATFFINGNNRWYIYDEKSKKVLNRMKKEGHQIENHTWNHQDLMTLSKCEISYEIKQLEKTFKNILGFRPKYLRPPYGSYDERVQKIIENKGYNIVMWSLDTVDWKTPEKEPDFSILTGNSLNKKIVLQHDTLYFSAIKFTEKLIKYGKEKGIKFMTLNNCLKK